MMDGSQTGTVRRARATGLAFAAVYVACLTGFVFANPIEFFPEPHGVAAVTEVEFTTAEAVDPTTLEKLSPRWLPIALPDDWSRNHDVVELWYRAHLDLPDDAGNRPWAIYLPHVVFNAAVFVNGTWVGQGGRFDEPLSRHWNEPLLFEFSGRVLKPGPDVVHIRVKTTVPRKGFLNRFYIGHVETLRAAHTWKHFARVELSAGICVALTIIAGIMLTLWLLRDHEPAYGYFGIAAAGWAVHFLNTFVTDIPIAVRPWEALIYVSYGWGVVAIALFNHSFTGVRVPVVEFALKIFAALGVVILIVPDIEKLEKISVELWDVGLIGIGIYSMAFVAVVYYRRPRSDVYLIFMAGLTILVFGVHDILVLNYLWDKSDSVIMQYGVMTAIFVITWFLITRFTRSLADLESLNDTLESRVKEREQEIAEQFRELGTLQREQLLARERERIMRDMHDGIGGQLVSLVASLRQQGGSGAATRVRVEEVLHELRLVVHSLDPKLHDLSTMLATLRARMSDQLAETGIVLEWHASALPDMENLSSQDLLDVTRIVQEALANTLKHTRATHVRLSTYCEGRDWVVIEISSNHPIPNAQWRQDGDGHGLQSMSERADRIGGEIQFVDGTVRLSIPVQAAP